MVVGYYTHLIENIRDIGGDYMACMRSVVDTYKIVGGNQLEVVNSRDFDIDSYRRSPMSDINAKLLTDK